MKKAKKNMLLARLLLLMFCLGQYMAFAHTHIKQVVFSTDKQHRAVFKERCDVCDAMQHTQALTAQQVFYVPAMQCITLHVESAPGFTPIQLVLAAGRAPPVAC